MNVFKRFGIHEVKRSIRNHIAAQRHPGREVFRNFQTEGETVRFVRAEVERAVRESLAWRPVQVVIDDDRCRFGGPTYSISSNRTQGWIGFEPQDNGFNSLFQ